MAEKIEEVEVVEKVAPTTEEKEEKTTADKKKFYKQHKSNKKKVCIFCEIWRGKLHAAFERGYIPRAAGYLNAGEYAILFQRKRAVYRSL